VIALAGNVLVPAVLALRATGYAVSREDSSVGETWRAERSDRVLIANDPVQLLGLASMRDTRGSDWRPTDAEIDLIMEQFRT